jgi:citrate synthase
VPPASDICSVSGQRGKLAHRRHDVRNLTEQAAFEEVAYPPWNGRLPKQAKLEELEIRLAENRRISLEIVDLLMPR